MKTISFKVSEKEYEELKQVKHSPWKHFFLSSVSCPYCGNLFLFSTGKKLLTQQIGGELLSDTKFGDWPYIRRMKEKKYDIDIIATGEKIK